MNEGARLANGTSETKPSLPQRSDLLLQSAPLPPVQASDPRPCLNRYRPLRLPFPPSPNLPSPPPYLPCSLQEGWGSLQSLGTGAPRLSRKKGGRELPWVTRCWSGGGRGTMETKPEPRRLIWGSLAPREVLRRRIEPHLRAGLAGLNPKGAGGNGRRGERERERRSLGAQPAPGVRRD